ncbi:MAG: polyamine aminopropyltransferase [Pigmentiphaga sp.]|uniref:polyamine aminopropyltransferase n=1 Tax=Pigmentiphaga sp. TaxID=1977564 RepID=UPI0029A84FF9|nr:polyamine aminopropyltransferase [Pigmentiphaga sp.]MDX3906068.1 polyamine aminopropyltransferase [Pigmentiphaga sp.]
MQGLHLTADLYQCACDPVLMTDADALARLCRRHTFEAGLTLVAEKWHTFPEYQGQPGGVTGMLLLAESHLAVHTWPERKGVTLDVYVCNFQEDNSRKAEALMRAIVEAFRPGDMQRQRLSRGDAEGPADVGELLLEDVAEQAYFGFRFDRRILNKQTAYQHLELLESPTLGRTLRLDGRYMTSEAEEFFYHEALVHPAATAHPAPRSALIIGGGDGGALEELLKHRTIERATLVDLDGDVIEVAREHLRNIHRGALDDPRATILAENGVDFLERTPDRFDLVLLDLTDPDTPAGPLYTAEFFRRCKEVLTTEGALVLHIGSPFHQPDQVRGLCRALRSVFAHVRPYGLHIPLYGTYWGLAVASDVLDPPAVSPGEIQARLAQREVGDLQYYNADVHGALFALPNYYRKLSDD